MPPPKPHQTSRARKPSTTPDTGTIYFYMPDAKPYGVFCQWHASIIVVPITSLHFLNPSPTILASHGETITFTCAEQMFMFSKALFSSDASSCQKIMATYSPKEQKRLGRNVTSFNEHAWNIVKSRVARVGN